MGNATRQPTQNPVTTAGVAGVSVEDKCVEAYSVVGCAGGLAHGNASHLQSAEHREANKLPVGIRYLHAAQPRHNEGSTAPAVFIRGVQPAMHRCL